MSNGGSRKLLGEEAQSKFKRFELLIIASGSLAIIASALISYEATDSMLELVGQLLMLPVLLISLQYGRAGSLISSLLASLVYVVARAPDLNDLAITGTTAQLLGVRILSYLIIGFVGGEVMSAVKYYFARSGGLGGIDPESGLYVAEYIRGMIEKAIFSYERYGAGFSVVVLSLNERLRDASTWKSGKSLIHVGAMLKSTLRIVDEVGRLDHSRFAVLLPHTNLTGARVVGERLARMISDYYAIPVMSCASVKIYGASENLDELRELVGLPPRPIQPVETEGKPKGA